MERVRILKNDLNSKFNHVIEYIENMQASVHHASHNDRLILMQRLIYVEQALFASEFGDTFANDLVDVADVYGEELGR